MSKLTHTQIAHLADHVATVMTAFSIADLISPLPAVSAINDLPEMEAWETRLIDLVENDPILPGYEELGQYHSEILEFLINYFTPEADDPYRNDSTHGIGKNT